MNKAQAAQVPTGHTSVPSSSPALILSGKALEGKWHKKADCRRLLMAT